MPSPLPRSFNGLAWSNLAAQSAEQLSLAAVPIVAVLALGAGAGEIGTLAAAQTLPFLLLSIPFGLWADRTSRLRLLVWAETLRLLAFLGLLAVLLAGGLSLTMLALLGFLGAVGTVGFSVAAPALVPSLVPRSQLAQANGRLELARSVAFAGGPALAGALVAWAGASAAFVLAAALSVCAITLLLRLREPARPPAAPRHALLELRDGALLVWRHPLLRPVFTTSVAWNMSWFVLQAAYVPYAMRLLGLDARGVGFTLAAYGAGMIVGALVARRIMGAISFGHTIVLGPLVSVLAQPRQRHLRDRRLGRTAAGRGARWPGRCHLGRAGLPGPGHGRLRIAGLAGLGLAAAPAAGAARGGGVNSEIDVVATMNSSSPWTPPNVRLPTRSGTAMRPSKLPSGNNTCTASSLLV